MGYKDLISLDYSFEVDTSNLDTRLDEIEQKIADLGGDDILDEDAVTRIVESMDYLPRDDAQDFIARDDVEQIVRDLMHSEGDDFVQNVLDNGSYVTEYDLNEKIGEEIDNRALMTSDEVNAAIEIATSAVMVTIDSLTEQVKAQDSAIDALQAKLADAGELSLALTFFSLLRKAFDALRN